MCLILERSAIFMASGDPYEGPGAKEFADSSDEGGGADKAKPKKVRVRVRWAKAQWYEVHWEAARMSKATVTAIDWAAREVHVRYDRLGFEDFFYKPKA